MSSWYSYAEQIRQYREEAWDMGCTCPMLPPHIHLGTCPLYPAVKAWNEDYTYHLDQEHEDDEGRSF
jgi:hypothetical protein